VRRDPKGRARGQIRTLFDAGTATGLTDGQLLERFATRRDAASEVAFAALVERHGPMVLRACRAVLRDDHEALDAFQATFLVLARKGGTLWVRDSIGPWLHRVACRAACRAKKAAARRRALEQRAAELAERRAGAPGRDELAALIHEEVDRLPERYRTAVVLCDLEGRTCEEAARHLGCPVGTVGSRLARGRRQLRDRLSRRGLAARAVPLAALRWQRPRGPVPPELVGPTAAAAARFVSSRAALRGPAASLALEVLGPMTATRWLKAASVLLALTASTTGVVSLVGGGAAVAVARPDDEPKAAPAATTEVKRGRLSLVVDTRGRLEASRSADVYSSVEGQTTILSIVPEGTRVTKGQLICELDSAALKDRLVNQSIALKKAEAAYQNAKLTREAAEIAVKEYADGIYPRERQKAMAEMKWASEAMNRLHRQRKQVEAAQQELAALLRDRKEPKTPADILATLDVDARLEAVERAYDRETKALYAAREANDALSKFTKEKTVKQLQIQVETARAAEIDRQSAFELERSKEAKLQRQIESCKIYAPADGTLVYANDPAPAGNRPTPQIEEGATVRERQKLFSVPDLNVPMRTVVHAPEAVIDQVRPGQKARIKVDAFPNETFDGVVEAVAPLSDPTNFFQGAAVNYTTHVAFSKGIPHLRPGMTASIEIPVVSLDDVLTVPAQAVARYDKKDHVAVKTPGGGVDWREVTLGATDGKSVEVKDGLKAGEAVVTDPTPLLTDEQKRQTPPAPPKPGRAGKRARPKAEQ